MNQEFLSQRKADLEKKKRELEKDLKSFAEKPEGAKNNWQTNFPKMNNDDEDRGDEVEEYENLLPVEYTLEDDLRDVSEALKRLEKGTYGKCENCNREISEERLIIFPEAKNCNTCSIKPKKRK